MTVDYSNYQGLLFERPQPGVLLITINRPEKLNAADEELHEALGAVWLDVDRDPETRVVVITGAGRAFSAGGDIEMQRRALGNYRRVVHTMQQASDEAMAVAGKLANGSQDAIRWTKKALNNWLRQAGPLFDASLALEMLGLFGADVVEGLDAVVEKRSPVFPSVSEVPQGLQ